MTVFAVVLVAVNVVYWYFIRSQKLSPFAQGGQAGR